MFHLLALMTALSHPVAGPQTAGPNSLPANCGLPAHGTKIMDPPELRSRNRFVDVTLFLKGNDPTHPSERQVMCYVYRLPGAHGERLATIPPTLRVKQGDRIVLSVVDELFPPGQGPALAIDRGTAMADEMASGGGVDLACGQPQTAPTPSPNPHTGRIYGYHRSPWNETNMHFHGLNTSPQPPGDNVTHVMICPRKAPNGPPNSYTYIVDIPRNEPPGLYWYHPHAHGESESQVQFGLTGAIIVDPLAASPIDQMPNRVIIVRDSILNGDLRPNALNAMLQQTPIPDFADLRTQISSPSFVANDGRKYPFQNPASCPPRGPQTNLNSKEISVNTIPLPLTQIGLKEVPETTIPAGQTQFWRLANTASDTVLDLEMRVDGAIVPMQVVSRDGVPLVQKNGHPTWQAVPMNEVVLAPAGRVEFYLTGAKAGSTIVIRTRKFDAGCLGDVELLRYMVVVHVKPAQRSTTPRAPQQMDPVPTRFSDLGFVPATKQRTFAFTEYPRPDTSEPDFYITQMSDPNAVETPFTMNEPPAVVVKNGTVEDWTVLNYTQEVHAFHIHQIHFLVLDSAGMAYGQGQLMDTIVVPFGTFPNGGKRGSQMVPGMVKLRMDFRGKDIVGTFVYHCHLLEHEDNGMMAKIRVLP